MPLYHKPVGPQQKSRSTDKTVKRAAGNLRGRFPIRGSLLRFTSVPFRRRHHASVHGLSIIAH